MREGLREQRLPHPPLKLPSQPPIPRETMPKPSTSDQQQAHFHRVKNIIQQEEMWERVPEHARDFSPENLENLVKYAYFAGFIDMSQVIRLLFLKKGERSHILHKWYEDIRDKGCWLC